ncbi:ABC transporter permease subunit [Virgibacillus sp. YIM 98842]|uniref:ABC transporter permease n=1 Tax=Virgibacillus sp. YIM 98842 TaxID=2663533 RepID=UPI0013DB6D07|nr:ABC transporter permease subunit [Virgibacillus sp. YIM 98842]
MQWMTLFKKEIIENWRNKKWIWVPLIFILLAIIDPISNYYMPQIIDSIGGMPEGAVFEIPELSSAEVILMTLGQLSSLGVLVIILMSMGAIAGERKSGVIELILVKPVSYQHYITAKWAALLSLVWTALILGLTACWYYTVTLFGELPVISLLQIIFFYGLWITLVVTIVIFYNSFVKTPGLVAFLSIATIMAMSLLTQVFGRFLEWSPNNLSGHIFESLMIDQLTGDLIATAFVTMGLIISFLIGAIILFRRKSLAE